MSDEMATAKSASDDGNAADKSKVDAPTGDGKQDKNPAGNSANYSFFNQKNT